MKSHKQNFIIEIKMKLTKEQIEFLNKVCKGRDAKNLIRGFNGEWWINSKGEVDVDGWVVMKDMNLTEIPVKFGRVEGHFNCSNNKLTTLKNYPTLVYGGFYCENNNLSNYFKSTKEEDFPHWDKLGLDVLIEYPYLINIFKNVDYHKEQIKFYITNYPQTKLYLE